MSSSMTAVYNHYNNRDSHSNSYGYYKRSVGTAVMTFETRLTTTAGGVTA
jgi:hypothetical protein